MRFLDEFLTAEQVVDATRFRGMSRRPDFDKIRAHEDALTNADVERIIQATATLIPSSDWAPPGGWRMNNSAPNGGRWVNRRRGLVAILTVGIGNGALWAHFSMSGEKRTPSYKEMCEAKEAFLGAERQAIAIYPPRSKHVNLHPYVLHLWCGLDGDGLPDFTDGTGSI